MHENAINSTQARLGCFVSAEHGDSLAVCENQSNAFLFCVSVTMICYSPASCICLFVCSALLCFPFRPGDWAFFTEYIDAQFHLIKSAIKEGDKAVVGCLLDHHVAC